MGKREMQRETENADTQNPLVSSVRHVTTGWETDPFQHVNAGDPHTVEDEMSKMRKKMRLKCKKRDDFCDIMMPKKCILQKSA